MILQAEFTHMCEREELRSFAIQPATICWRAPIKYLLWWDDGQVLILPDDLLALCDQFRRTFAVATFDTLDEAMATYNLLNP